MNLAEAIVWLALIAAAVTLIVTGHGIWIVAVVVAAFFLL